MNTDELYPTPDEVREGLILPVLADVPAPGFDLSEPESEDGPLNFSATVEEAQCESVGLSATAGALSATAGVLSLPPDDDEEGDHVEAQGCAGSSCDLPADDHSVTTGSWVPGLNAGSYAGYGTALSAQGQVLVGNVYSTVRSLPNHLLGPLANYLGRTGHESRPMVATARVLGLPRSLVARTVHTLGANQWMPTEIAGHGSQAGQGLPRADRGHTNPTDEDQLAVLVTLTRAALSLGDSGYNSFPLHVARLATAGVTVGDRFHTPKFAEEAVFLAARCVQGMDAADLRMPLPALGVRSSLALLIDGVPIAGMSAHGRQGSAIVICANFVGHQDGVLRPRLLTWAVPDKGHGGLATAEAVARALEQSPLNLGANELRPVLSLVGGDGQVARGGPTRTTTSTQSAEFLWRQVYGLPAPHVVPTPEDPDDVPLAALVAGPPPSRARREAWLADRGTLWAATEWDKFHREDIVLSRAVADVPLAQELFSVCSLMDQWFNLGEGRLLVKMAAKAVGLRLQSGALPGVSRKVVALAQEPGHLLHNLPAYAVGVHGRFEHKRQDHDGPKLHTLASEGRRLTCLDLIAFTTLFADIMRSIVAPWALVVQSSCMEPWVTRRQQLKHEALLDTAFHSLEAVRKFLRVLVLLRQHCHTTDLCCFVDAWFCGTPRQFCLIDRGTPFGKLFPTFWMSLNSFINFGLSTTGCEDPTFRQVTLLTVPMGNPADWTDLGAHCQCATRQNSRTPQSHKIRVSIRGHRRRVRVPHWVSEAKPRVVVELDGGLARVGVRRYRTADLPNLGRPQDPNRYRQHILRDTSRCIMPPLLMAAFDDVDAACCAAWRFVFTVREEHDKMFGSEGSSAGMRALVDAMVSCFDWERVVQRPPANEAIHAFGTLYDMLLPYLRHTEWPPVGSFPGMEHRWPSKEHIQLQYVVLCRRLRSRGNPPWWVLEGAIVEPLERSSFATWFVNAVFGPLMCGEVQPRLPARQGLPAAAEDCTARALLAKVTALISLFLGGVRRREIKVSLRALAFVGYAWRGRMRPQMMREVVARVWRCRLRDPIPGGVATLLLPGAVGKLVYIRRPLRSLDWCAVSATLDVDRSFAVGVGGDRTCAWHALRIHNFCRPMGSPEAVCERVGSLMHMQHESCRHISLGVLMDEVLLRDAQVSCIGHPRDERICAEVARCLLSMGRKPLVGDAVRYSGTDTLRRARVRQQERMRASGRAGFDGESTDSEAAEADREGEATEWSHAGTLKDALHMRREMSVPDYADKKVLAKMELSGRYISALPLQVHHPAATAATRRVATQNWLDAAEGQAWLAEKRTRHNYFFKE